MKRLLCFLMVFILCLTSLPVATAEEAEFIYDDEQLKQLYAEFKDVSGSIENVFGQQTNLTYWKLSDELENGSFVKKCFKTFWDIGAYGVKEPRDKKFYTEVLAGLITMMDYELALQIENQSQFDNMKSSGEYLFNVIDIAATAVGISKQYQTIADSLSAFNNGSQLLIDNMNDVKYYEQTVRSYAESDSFLRAIVDYTDNDVLREAAQEMRSANDDLLEERLNYLISTGENLLAFGAKSYMDILSFCYLGTLEKFGSNECVSDCVTYCEIILETLAPAEATLYKLGMVFGDVFFGTTNVFRRYNELIASAEIAQCLVNAYEDIDVSPDAPAKTFYSNMKAKCGLYKNLLSIHVRGEYLIYSLRYNDSGIISEVKKLCELLNKPVTQEWYDEQTSTIAQHYQRVNQLFLKLGTVRFVVQDGFELHNGFIEEVRQQKTVPDGYIGIYSYEDFKQISDSCPSNTQWTSSGSHITDEISAKYILMNDITLPADHDPAGFFYGTVDGNGYTIHTQDALFCELWGEVVIENLGIEIQYNANMEDKSHTFGAIAYSTHWDDLGDKDVGCMINNCFVKGSISFAGLSGEFGALVGEIDDTRIQNCYSTANISLRTQEGCKLGGIAGIDTARECIISNCYNTGDLIARTCLEDDGPVYVGGIMAESVYTNITNCYNTGTVTAEANEMSTVYAGGICGELSADGSFKDRYEIYIESCYNIGDVKTDCFDDSLKMTAYGVIGSGGITGRTAGGNFATASIIKCSNSGKISGIHYAGGITGFSALYGGSCKVPITDCYNIGAISANDCAGGIAGYLTSGKISTCYNTGAISKAKYCGTLAGEAVLDDEHVEITDCCCLENGTPAIGSPLRYEDMMPLTKEELKDPFYFENFDFAQVWKLDEGDDSPTLRY